MILRPVPHILFVCVHNAGRSQMAAAWLNHLAAGRATAASAGTQPAARVHLTVQAVMREVGIDLSAARPQLLTEELAASATRIIAMGCVTEAACPAVHADEDWGLPDPAAQPPQTVRAIRDEIRARVEALLHDLS